MKNLKPLLTLSATALMLFGCGSQDETAQEPVEPETEDVGSTETIAPEDTVVDAEEPEEENKDILTTHLITTSNHNFLDMYVPQMASALENEGVVEDIHDNLINSPLVVGKDEQYIQMMKDIQEVLHADLNENPAPTVMGKPVEGASLFSDPSPSDTNEDIVEYDDIQKYDNLITNTLNDDFTAIIVLDKRIDNMMTSTPDATLDRLNMPIHSLVDEIKELDATYQENPTDTNNTNVSVIVYENDNYLVSVTPDIKIYSRLDNKNAIQDYIARFETEDMQQVFDQYLSE